MHAVDKELLLERRRLTGQVLAITVGVVLAGLALAQGALYLLWLAHSNLKSAGLPPSPAHPWLAVLALGFLGLLFAGWKTRQAWIASAQRAGRQRDERLAASKNRLEASGELRQSAEPLAHAQREETAAYLARRPVRRRSHVLGLTTACVLALLFLNGTLADRLGGVCRAAAAAAARAAAQTPAVAKKNEPAKPPPYARIDIVSPESETKATPIEEVVVTGKSDSDNGFTALSLHASLNGAPDQTLPVDPNLFAKGGPTKFDQSMLLDQLKAQPFDVVSYYFQGTSRHEKPLTVSSPMQFIEVRPFREDIHKTLGSNHDSQCWSKLGWLISQQLIISKRSWIIASSQLPPSDSNIVTATGQTGDAQDKIAGKTDELFQDMTKQGYPASIVDHVSLAGTSMHQAVGEIRKPALLAANPLQRRALGELVEATKNFIKVAADRRSAGVNPNALNGGFKDKQKIPPPSKPPATNPMVHLKNLIKREQDIVKDLASSSSPVASPANPPEPDSGNKDPLLAHSDLIPPPSSGGGPPEQHPSPPSSPPPRGGSSSGKSMAAETPIVPKPGQEILPLPPQSPPDPSAATASSDKPFGKGNAPQPPPQPGAGSGNKPGVPQTAQAAQALAQAQIAQELAQMQDQPGSEPASNTALAEAQAAVHASALALTAQDQAGALNAARNAEAAMLRAHEALAAAAGAQMRDELAQAQQQLQDAAQAQRHALTPAEQAAIARQTQAVSEAMLRAREEQTASGDPQLASLADSLLRKFGDSGILAKLDGLGHMTGTSDSDRIGAADMMSKFADQMATTRLAMQSEAKNLEDVLQRLDRVEHNMDQTRGTPEEQAQFAQELNADLKTALSDANTLLPPQESSGSGSSPGSQGGTGPADENQAFMHQTASGYVNAPLHPVSPAAFRGLREPLAALRVEIVQRLDLLRNQEELTYLNPDQSPEEYRAQVAAYYERISREAKAAPPDAARPSSP
jgi:hypothetical protein